MKKGIFSLLLLAVALLALGCTFQGADRASVTTQWLVPTAKVNLGEGGAINIAMGFVNESKRSLPQQDDLAGQWVLLNAEGEVRARGRVLTAGPLDARETSFPLVWSGALESGRYTLKWGSPSIGTVTTEFSVLDGGAGVGVIRQETSEQFTIDQQDAPQR